MENTFEKNELKNKAIEGTMLLTARTIALQFIVTGANIVLARLFLPDFFGVMSIMLFVIGLGTFFSDIGLSKALVQMNDQLSPKSISSTFFVHLVFSTLTTILIWLITPLLMQFYGSHVPQSMGFFLRLFALAVPFSTLGAVPKALLERKLAYKPFILGEISLIVISKTITIVLAVMGLGISAFVIGELVGRLASSLLYLSLSPIPLATGFSFKTIKPLFAFASSFQTSSILQFLNSAIIPMYITIFPGPGVKNGAEAAGLISFSLGIVVFCRIISDITNQMSFSVISRSQKDPTIVSKIVERALILSILSTMITSCLVFILIPQILSVIYTDKWLGAVQIIRLLLISGIITSISNVFLQALLALGNAKTFRNANILQIIVQWIITMLLVPQIGIVGYGFATIISSAIILVLCIGVKKEITIQFPVLFIGKLSLIFMITTVSFSFLTSFFTFNFSLLSIIFEAGIIFVIFFGMLHLLALQTMKLLYAEIWPYIRKKNFK